MKPATAPETAAPRALVATTLLALTLSLAACEPEGETVPCAPEGPEPGTTCVGELTTSTGATRTYRLHFPPDYDGATPLPLVMNLPGLDQASEVHEWGSGMSSYADDAGFIVVYPDSLRMWYTAQLSSRDVLFLSELADDLVDRFAVDDRRLYVTGISNGGAMAASLACERSEQFAAFAPVAPVIGHQGGHYTCDPERRPVPMMFVIGEDDGFVRWPEPLGLAADWADVNGANPSPTLTTGPVMDTYVHVHPTAPEGDVTLVLAHEMAHTWPSRAGEGFDGNAEVWSFFQQHALP